MVARFLLALLLASLLSPAFGDNPTVTRIVDGDTIVLSTGEKVRLIGVDTPEIVDPWKPLEPGAGQASDFLKRFVLGKQVQVRYDRERYDKYHRTLAYLYLNDGTLVNSEIIRRGYGSAYIRFPFKFQNEFLAVERTAKARKAGIWAPKPKKRQTDAPVMGRSSETVFITRTGKRWHNGGCRYLARSRIPITKEEATTRGYTPCSVCARSEAGTPHSYQPPASRATVDSAPPTSGGDTVYVTRTGSKYHCDGCRYLARSQIPMSRAEAITSGYTPCSVCRP